MKRRRRRRRRKRKTAIGKIRAISGDEVSALTLRYPWCQTFYLVRHASSLFQCSNATTVGHTSSWPERRVCVCVFVCVCVCVGRGTGGTDSGGSGGGSGPKQKTRNCKPHYQRPYLFMRLEAGGWGGG